MVLLIGSCSTHKQHLKSDNSEIQDGFYLILREGNIKKDLMPIKSGEKLITFSDLFLEKTDPGTLYLVIKSDEFVPMLLKEKPEAVKQEDKRTRLLLTLNEEAKIELAKFTKKYINRQTSIVVGGEALTMHKVKMAIEGGRMQITRCTDNACAILFPILEENVVKN